VKLEYFAILILVDQIFNMDWFKVI
jgi:hypothetical protein